MGRLARTLALDLFKIGARYRNRDWSFYPERRAHALPEASMSKSQTRFLFIDDEDLVLNALRRTLRKEPFEFHFTNDPESAFRMVAELGIDCVISDQSMPNMSGVEFFAILRRLHESVVRVMMSGQSDRDTTLRAINEGQVSRFIEKPWNNDELRAILAGIDRDLEIKRRAARVNEEQPRAHAHTSILRDATGAVVLTGVDLSIPK